MDFNELPKVELHLHLDCSLSFDVISRINPAISRAEYEQDFIAPAKCLNLPDYLTRALRGVALMQTEAQLRLVTADLFDQLVHDNVIYAEIRFAPLLHTQNGLAARDVVEIVDEAVARGSEATGVESRLILCTLRHFTREQSMATVMLVERFLGRRVAAFDIAGDEAGFPVDAHVPAFRHAIANRIHRTAHAGEAAGPQSMWETLRHFRPTRIGHGVRSIEDRELLEHLKMKRIHLEVCPTSNVQINIFDRPSDHPVDRLYSAGVSVGINTDARTISNITLAHEYQLLHEMFGWDVEHFRICNLNALGAAFVPETLREQLADRLRERYKHL